MNKNKGISLIVLVITIIVIIILAGAVIMSLSTNNPISQASKAKYLSDLRNFQTELDLYKTKQFVNNLGSYNPLLLKADDSSVTYNSVVDVGKTIYDLIPSLGQSGKYTGQMQIIDGSLTFGGADTVKQDWSREIGVEVVLIGEPRITIIPPAQTLAQRGTDIVYTIKFSSNLALTTVNLTGKVEVLDNLGVALASQPVINIGTVSGTSSDALRQVDVTIKTDILLNGSYDVRIKPGAVTDSGSKTTTIATTSLIGFDVLDDIPPANPTMVASPSVWTNGNVTVTITYSADTATKQYSLDAATWNPYTVPVVVSVNNTTVYAKGLDVGGNQTAQTTITISNIDKIVPTVTAGNGGATTSSVTVNAVAADTGGSSLTATAYQYSSDNGTSWTTANSSSSYTFTGLTPSTVYTCKVKVTDNAGNSAISTGVAISTIAPVIITYNYTGGVQSWTVTNTGKYKLECYGSAGGGGALGGYAAGEINLTSGQVLNCYVGGVGYNGGLTGAYYAQSNSGGGSDIRIGGTALGNRVIVAGGGGGTGNLGSNPGGVGGGATGGTSASLGSGNGGTQSAGGVGGVGVNNGTSGFGNPGTNGSLGSGGAGGGSHATSTYGGHGGGGYYGGGGGGGAMNNSTGSGGGGGGSSYIDGVTNATTTAGTRTGAGLIVITQIQ
jgi:type II secretory pathway pseudopilin PulG